MPTTQQDHQHGDPFADGACIDEAGATDWYDSLRLEVDYQCTFCEGLHLHISELEAKVKEAYAATARSMKGLYDSKEIASRWMGMWAFATELLASAEAASEVHQICGTDLTELKEYQKAAWERLQLHCTADLACP